MTYGMGWLRAPDIRDGAYAMGPLLPDDVTIKEKIWTPGPVLNQGDTPECVGHAAYGALLAEPDPWTPDDTTVSPDAVAQMIYQAAQLADGIPLPHDGSTTRAAAKVLSDSAGPLSKAGKAPFTAYVWAQTVEDMRRWVLLKGPVFVGSLWRQAMFTPDSNGYLIPDGEVVGGHEWLVIGYRRNTDTFLMRNSWGASWSSAWGLPGCALVHATDMDCLLHDSGDACAPTHELV